MEAYSKRLDLADALVSAVRQLQQAQAQTNERAFRLRSTQSPGQWRVGDRLSQADTERLLAAFSAGTSKRKLAERYGISESSVKRLIRQHGTSKPSSGLFRHQWPHLVLLSATHRERAAGRAVLSGGDRIVRAVPLLGLQGEKYPETGRGGVSGSVRSTRCFGRRSGTVRAASPQLRGPRSARRPRPARGRRRRSR
jgi:hypothetical protein